MRFLEGWVLLAGVPSVLKQIIFTIECKQPMIEVFGFFFQKSFFGFLRRFFTRSSQEEHVRRILLRYYAY